MFDVYYTPQMVGPEQQTWPSAHKPAAVVASWLNLETSVDRFPSPITQ